VEEGSEGLARSKEPVPAIQIDQTSPKKTWTLSDRTGYLPSGVSTPPPPVATHYFIKVARTTMGLEWR